jgi:hypothetical protein
MGWTLLGCPAWLSSHEKISQQHLEHCPWPYFEVKKQTTKQSNYKEMWEDIRIMDRGHYGHSFTDHVTQQCLTESDSHVIIFQSSLQIVYFSI